MKGRKESCGDCMQFFDKIKRKLQASNKTLCGCPRLRGPNEVSLFPLRPLFFARTLNISIFHLHSLQPKGGGKRHPHPQDGAADEVLLAVGILGRFGDTQINGARWLWRKIEKVPSGAE